MTVDVEPILVVGGLTIGFESAGGLVPVVEDVSFGVRRGESVALVGESGCGKSVTARSLLRLQPSPPAHRLSGHVEIAGQSVYSLSGPALRRLRGERVGFVFQDPMTALNPVYPIGEQIAERVRRFKGLSRRAARATAESLLERVGISSPKARARDYPHQLSGGMRQRVVVAIALACEPDLLIADEPTTALDVTIQAQILTLIRSLQQASNMALLLITHDLGVVAQVADRVLVMYAGQLVEEAPVEPLFEVPRHPYTRGLLRSVPGVVPPGSDGRLWSIPGSVPRPQDFPDHCRFYPRCPVRQAVCQEGPVAFLTREANGDGVRCRFPNDEPIEYRAA